MLVAGSVYTWTIISRSIAATFPDWSAQTLSMTFTITMMGYAAGGMISGVLLKKTGPKFILALGAILFSGGMMISSFAQTPGLLYTGFGAMCGLATGLCYNSTVSTVSAWFPDKQGVASGTLLAGFGMSSFIAGKLFAALRLRTGADCGQLACVCWRFWHWRCFCWGSSSCAHPKPGKLLRQRAVRVPGLPQKRRQAGSRQATFPRRK